jgi:hypothetical protein
LFDLFFHNLGHSLKANILIYLVLVSVVVTLNAGVFFLILYVPNLLFYPAVLVSICILFPKSVAVLVHTPRVKQLSMKVSRSEGSYESSYQLLLMLLSWQTGGRLHIVPILASLLMIGKTRAEKLLASHMDYQMHKKSFCERVVLVLDHMPTFSLATVFRLGSPALILSSLQPGLWDMPVTVVRFFILHFCFTIYCALLCLLLLVGRWQPGLSQLTVVEAVQGVIGGRQDSPPPSLPRLPLLRGGVAESGARYGPGPAEA